MKRSFLRIEFVKGALVLMVGTILGQLIPIVLSPILTRQYTPTDFGVFASFFALVSTLAPIASGRYELAVMLPKKESESEQVVTTTKYLILIQSVFLLAFFILFECFSHNDLLLGIDNWFFILALTIAAVSLFQLALQVSIRKSNYKRLAVARVLQGGVSSLVPIFFYFISEDSIWLILGGMLGFVVAVLYLKTELATKHISLAYSIEVIKKYRNQPMHMLPADLLNIGSNQGIIFLISMLFGPSSAGLYFMTYRIVSGPVSLVGASIGQVFFKKFAEIANAEARNERSILLKVWLVLAAVGIVPFTLVFLFGERFFEILFGAEWFMAGRMASILSLAYFANFVSSPTSSAIIVLGLTRYIFYFGIYAFVFRLLAILIGYLYGDIVISIMILAAVEFLQILIYNIVIWRNV